MELIVVMRTKQDRAELERCRSFLKTSDGCGLPSCVCGRASASCAAAAANHLAFFAERFAMQSPKDHLTIKIGKWFEATANGPYAITVLAALVGAGGFGRWLGWW